MIGFAVVLKQLCQIAFTINRRILQEWHEIVLSNDSTPFKDFNTFVSYVATISLKVSLWDLRQKALAQWI